MEKDPLATGVEMSSQWKLMLLATKMPRSHWKAPPTKLHHAAAIADHEDEFISADHGQQANIRRRYTGWYHQSGSSYKKYRR